MSKNVFCKRALCFCLSALLLIGAVWSDGLIVNAASDTNISSSGQYVYRLTADEDTSEVPEIFGTTDANGKVWTDKSVSVASVDDGSFDVKLSALAQEYLNEVEHKYTQKSNAADVMLILDLSTSMQAAMDSTTRIEAITNALNKAIGTIMDANPYNRVMVTGYYYSSYIPILPLNSYVAGSSKTVNGESVPVYLNFTKDSTKALNSYISVDSKLKSYGLNKTPADAATVSKSVSSAKYYLGYWTGTQGGIVDSIQGLLSAASPANNSYEENDIRSPFVMLLTDGLANCGANNWYDDTFLTRKSDYSDAPDDDYKNSKQIGISHTYNQMNFSGSGYQTQIKTSTIVSEAQVAALTVLAAEYQTKLLNESYQTWFENEKIQTTWLTVGVALDSSDAAAVAVIDPQKLDTLTGSTGPWAFFNDYLTYAKANKLITSEDYDYYLDNYGYSKYVQYAESSSEISKALTKLSDLVSDYSTKGVTLPITTTSQTVSSAEIFITFTDELGSGMVLDTAKGISITLDDTKYTGTLAGGVYTFSNGDTTLTSTATVSGSTITWKVSADDLPVIRFKDRTNPVDGEYEDTELAPIALNYTAKASGKTALESDVDLYSNAYSDNTAKTYAVFTPTVNNPYYHTAGAKNTARNITTDKIVNTTSTVTYSGKDAWNTTDDNFTQYLGNNGRIEKLAKVSITSDTDSQSEGKDIVYTLKVENLSDEKLTNIVIKDNLGDNVTYKSSDTKQSSGNDTWTISSLDSGKSTEIKVTATAETITDSNTSSVTLTGLTVDNTTDNSLSASDSTDVEITENKTTVTYKIVSDDNPAGDAYKAPADETVRVDSSYTAKTMTEPSGWSFDGWYTDENCTEANKVADTTKVSEDGLKLYGKWVYGLDITKTVDATKEYNAGDEITYSITVTNNTDSDVSGLSVTDTLPENLTFKSANNNGSCPDDVVTWNNVSVKANSTTVLTVTATISDKITASSGSIINTATLKDNDGIETTDSSDPITPTPKQLTVEYHYVGTYPKNAELPTENNTVNYGDTYNNVKTQTPVGGWSFDGWYTDEECTKLYDASTPLEENLNLYGKWSNGLSISKTADKSTTYTAGETVTYTITVTNAAKTAASVQVVDTLPENLTVVVDGTTAGYSESGKTLTWSDFAVDAATDTANATATITVKATINEALTEADLADDNTISNTAKLIDSNSPDGTTPDESTSEITVKPQTFTVDYKYVSDTVPKGKTAPEQETVTYGTPAEAEEQTAPGWIFDGWYTDKDCTKKYDGSGISADTTLYSKWTYGVSMTKKVDKTEAVGGDTLTYTIELTNKSKTAVTDYSVTDKLPADYVDYQSAVVNDDSYNGQITYKDKTVTITGISIPAATDTANGTLTITVTVTLKSDLTETADIQNTAIGQSPTRDSSDNAASEKTTVSPRQVQVVYQYVAGTAVPQGASAPDGTGYVDYGSSFIMNQNGSKTTLTNADFWTFSGWYLDSALTSAAVQQALTSENYSALQNNGDTVTLYGKWLPVYSFVVEKGVAYDDNSVANGTVNMGSIVAYTVTVTNNNPESSTVISVADKVPEGLNIVESSIKDGKYENGIITWNDLKISGGETLSLTYNATVPSVLEDTVDYINTAYVTKADGKDYTGTGSENNNPGTVTFTGMPTVTPTVIADWSDTWDEHPKDTVYVNVYVYTNGTDAKVLKTVELTKDSQSWSDTLPAYDEDGNELTYSFKEYKGTTVLEEGDMNGLYKVGYTVSGDTTTINHVYQHQITDFILTKSASVKTAKAGDTFTYTITVTNKRTNETATGIVIKDKVPSNLIVTGTEYDNGTVENNDGTYIWSIPELAADSSETLILTVQVPEDTSAAEYKNIVKLTDIGGSTVDTPLSSEEVVTDVRSFTVTKEWYEGTEKVSASGKSDVIVQLWKGDKEYGKSVTLNSSNNWSYTWNNLPLKDDNGVACIYTVTEKAYDAYSTAISYGGTTAYGDSTAVVKNTINTNVVIYHYVSNDIPTGNNTPPAQETVNYGNSATAEQQTASGWRFDGWYTNEDCTSKYEGSGIITETHLYGKWVYSLDITKTADATKEYNAGDEITYSITVTNNTDADVSGLSVTDTLPADLAFKSADNNGSCPDGVVTWNNVSVKANSTTVLTVTATISDKITASSGSIINTATLKDNDGIETTDSSDPITPTPKQLTVEYHYVGTYPKNAELPTENNTVNYGDTYNNVKTQTPVGGWSFDGWYTDEECTKLYDASTPLEENLNLYGKWSNGLSISKIADNSTTYTAGEIVTYTITVTNAAKTAASVQVVDTLPENLTVVADGTTAGYSESGKTLTWSDFAVDAATDTANATATITVKATINEALTEADLADDNTISNTAKLIDSNSPDGTTPDESTSEITVKPQTFTVDYKYVSDTVPKGKTAPEQETVTYGTPAEAESQTAPGWTFDGWYTDKDCTKKYDGSGISADTTLYAKWSVAAVDTGDHSNPGIWFVVMSLSAAAFLILVLEKGKRANRSNYKHMV